MAKPQIGHHNNFSFIVRLSGTMALGTINFFSNYLKKL